MMKKLMIILAAALVIFTGCSEKQLDAQVIENKDGSVSITRIDEDGKAILFNRKFAGAENVTQVKLSETSRANPISIDLSAYEGKDVDIQFSCEMYVENKNSSDTQITWMINELNENFPKLYERKVPNGKWFNVNKHLTIHLSGKRQLYVSGAGFDKDNTTIYIKNFKLTLNGEGLTSDAPQPVSWVDAPSIKEA